MDAIRERRSIRKFKSDPVAEKDLREIIEAAILAPNAENAQMWYFVAVTNRELLNKIGDAVSKRVDILINACKTLDQEKELTNHKYFLVFFRDAPAIIAVFARPYLDAINKSLNIIDMKHNTPIVVCPVQQSIGMAVQNISLVAHAKGYGTTCMYGPVIAFREIGQLLDIQEPWVLSALLPIGIPEKQPKARPRKPLDEVYQLIK